LKNFKSAAKEIAKLVRELQPDSSSGTSKEIRGFQIIEAAQNGSFPSDLTASETRDLLKSLTSSLRKNEVNPSAAAKLVETLESLYNTTETTVSKGVKEIKYTKLLEINNEALQKVQKRFGDIVTGPDPFLPFEAGYSKFKEETGAEAEHPFIALIKEYNTEISDSKNQKKGAAIPKVNFKRKLVSFGKLFSVFAGQALQTLDGIDEFQVYFYSFNEKAGRAGSTNIAEFPIEMPIFLEHYKEHVEKYGTTDITLENFLMLVRDSQLLDTRALAYGFREFFQPFEPGKEAALIEKTQDEYENAIAGFSGKYGAFKKFKLIYIFVKKNGTWNKISKIAIFLKIFLKIFLNTKM